MLRKQLVKARSIPPELRALSTWTSEAAGLSLSLAGGASAGGAQVADAVTHKALVSHEITLGEEEIADVSLATFYVFDNENAGPSRRSERLACGCWTGTYYTSGNDAYPIPLRPVTTQPTGTCRSTFRKARGKHDQVSHPLSTKQYPSALMTASLPTN